MSYERRMLEEAIETPAVLIDLDVAEKNIRRAQSYCDDHGLALRPHIKTHKLPRIADLQLSYGAVGITCQKLSEAEAMVAGANVPNVLITYNILGKAKVDRLRRLTERVPTAVVADNPIVVEGLTAGFRDANTPLPVLVECNTGADRCGVSSASDAASLARLIDKSPGLKFAGLMTYPPAGHSSNKTNAWLEEARSLITSDGLTVDVISTGGSPDIWRAHEVPVATEYRIGTYVYNDRSLVEGRVCDYADCALTVLATVVSVPDKSRAVIDAGSKVLTSDLLGLEGYGHVLGRPDLKIDQLSEEHGRITAETPTGLKVGDTVRIVPNHACVVSNMVDYVVLTRGARFVGNEPVAARGKVW